MKGTAWSGSRGRGRAGARPERRRPVYAALDLGTNNCRLLIATPTPDGFKVIDSFSRIVRLGEGMGDPEEALFLSDQAKRRTIRALAVCANKMRRHDIVRSRCVATEACRRAANGEDFVRRVKRQTGIALDVLSCAEEAELAVAGCAPLLVANSDHALIFDIGGGSTELTWVGLGGDRPQILGARSMPCGVISLAERFGRDRYVAGAYSAMIDHVIELIAPFEACHRIQEAIRNRRVQMVGTSGTVTTLTGVKMNLPRYDRARVDGASLDFASIRRLSRELSEQDFESRAAHPCIGRDRADLVVAGCAVLEAVCRTWPVGSLTVADRGLREGILHGLIAAELRSTTNRRVGRS